jgi:acyl dehydratase
VTKIVNGLDELNDLVGEHLGYSDWMQVTQERIDMFADATDDHQWIHVDTERAKEGPFGGTVAYGHLTLALLVPLWASLLEIRGVSMGVNAGLNKVRFPAPVPVGAKIRAGATIASVKRMPGGVHVVVDLTVEREGSAKPVCVAQAVYLYYA